ncbi:helix-turn-helix domain-containing protein [Parasynechococcus marenigrum]|jgi:DNA-binding NarL/FixJ family response regulator|uniref:Possible transcriptional regulator, luxR family n=1 Tax=Parasynechococcus marenigrum (strain WH8102) TaxID=84588 RepID=Q7U4U0_PARMW|nr:helix-turn-helix transcriptional regulator [Parasynechococcus marenigrum]QNI92504.1 transcriptional regulator/ LuxR family [Synechococcus sp. BOUM118]QNJ17748.1 transcriptional regulator/ LuxR family [Synechococcus sp. A18-40]CAE08488.1 possible transcriptional regulator, luxR family [Parasynechococcus marenigrum WH 8102]|tara:strand:- start:458 stop:667 length:210 start_codon:yes stop_codon:yes gene_type:complete
MVSDIPLTPAEQRVSALLLQGLSNRAIAERLVISHRTVECHISRALAKTGCVNRLELALRMLTMPSTPA